MATSTDTTVANLADLVKQRYDHTRENRKPLQDKWNRNREYFQRYVKGEWKEGEAEDWRSKTVVNVTRQRVMTAYAALINLQLSDNEIAFGLEPSEEIQDPMLADAIGKEIDRMKKRIRGQLRDCKAERVLMRSTLSAALLGEFCIKKSIFTREIPRRVPMVPGGFQSTEGIDPRHVRWMKIMQMIDQPGIVHVPMWDAFRDLETTDPAECGWQIHRAIKTPRWLRGLMENPFCDPDAIKRVLAKVADVNNVTIDDEDIESLSPALRDIVWRSHNIRYIEYHGWVPRRYVETYETALQHHTGRDPMSLIMADELDDGDDVHVALGVCSDEVVMFSRTSLKDRPLIFGTWDEMADEMGSTGVADNVESAQITLNGLVRAAEDNSKLAGNVILGIKESYLEEPLDTIKPGTRIPISEDCDDVRKAIQQVMIQPAMSGIMELIQLFMQFSEEDPMLPRVVAGMKQGGDPTAYQIAKQLDQAGKYLSSVILNFDEKWTEPVIEYFFDWNMDDPEAQGKGDYKVCAKGFSNFQAKIELVSRLNQFLALMLSHPALEMEAKLRAIAKDIGSALSVDVEKYLKTDEEKQLEAQMRAQMAQSDPMNQLDIRERMAKIEAIVAGVAKTQAQIQEIGQKLTIERARTIKQITE